MKRFTKAQIRMLQDAFENKLRNHSPMRPSDRDRLRGPRGPHSFNTFNAIRHLLKRVEYNPLIQTYGIKRSEKALDEMAARGFLEKVAKGRYNLKAKDSSKKA